MLGSSKPPMLRMPARSISSFLRLGGRFSWDRSPTVLSPISNISRLSGKIRFEKSVISLAPT